MSCFNNLFHLNFQRFIYLFVGHMGLKSQNKMDFIEISRSMGLILDNTAAS